MEGYITIHDLRFTNRGARVWRLTHFEVIKANRGSNLCNVESLPFIEPRFPSVYSGPMEIVAKGRDQGHC